MFNGTALLVVEDEPTSRQLLAAYLENFGYCAYQADSAATAQSILSSHEIALILLDIGLPDEDGLTFARRLKWPQIPIVYVTEKAGDADKILALEAGGDDYITKPYNPKELVLRIRNILSRTIALSRSGSTEILDLPHHRIDFGRHTVTQNNGASVSLTRSEFALLRTLASVNGRTVTRETLLSAVNPDARYDAYDRTIDVLVSRIRKKLEQAPGTEVILTVPGHGYRLNN